MAGDNWIQSIFRSWQSLEKFYVVSCQGEVNKLLKWQIFCILCEFRVCQPRISNMSCTMFVYLGMVGRLWREGYKCLEPSSSSSSSPLRSWGAEGSWSHSSRLRRRSFKDLWTWIQKVRLKWATQKVSSWQMCLPLKQNNLHGEQIDWHETLIRSSLDSE